MGAARKRIDPGKPELPRQPQTGDLIRLKESAVATVIAACVAAGWDVDPAAVRVVTRADPWLPGEGRRLFVDGPPFAFNPAHVELAWKDGDQGDERRAMLRARGWKV